MHGVCVLTPQGLTSLAASILSMRVDSDRSVFVARVIQEVKLRYPCLEYAGTGGSRIVFSIDDQRVIKFSLPDSGSFGGQNQTEALRWAQFSKEGKSHLCCEVLEHAEDFSWLIMSRLHTLGESLLDSDEYMDLFNKVYDIHRILGIDFDGHGGNWGLDGDVIKLIDYGFIDPDDFVFFQPTRLQKK